MKVNSERVHKTLWQRDQAGGIAVKCASPIPKTQVTHPCQATSSVASPPLTTEDLLLHMDCEVVKSNRQTRLDSNRVILSPSPIESMSLNNTETPRPTQEASSQLLQRREKNQMSILLHTGQCASAQQALQTHTHRQVHVKLLLPWLPWSGNADCK